MNRLTNQVLKFAAVAALCGFAANAQAKTYSDEYLRTFYVATDALIRNWDGIDNQGTGTHVDNATTWKDLCDTSRYWNLTTGGSFSSNAVQIANTGGPSVYMPTQTLPDYQSIELCLYWKQGQQVLSNWNYNRIFILNWGDSTFGANRNYYAQGEAGSVVAGNSYCFAVTYNEQNTTPEKYYLDGERVTKTVSKPYGWATERPALGSRWNVSDCTFTGAIHAMRLYNRILTAEEVAVNAAVDKARFLGDYSDFERLIVLTMDASAALDAANGKIVVSTTVLHTDEAEEATLEAIVKRSDGVTTTNTIATAVVASETPYVYDVTDLVGGLAYEVVVRLSDVAGRSKELSTGNIYVGEVSVESVADADVTKDQKGIFRISRGTSETAVAYDLIVNLTFGGTAVMGRDYVEIPASVTIPAGESELLISVESLCNMDMPEGMTVSLTLGAGGYVPNPAASTATIGIVKPDLYHDWVYDSTAKTLSDGLWTFSATVSSGALTVGTLKKTYFKTGPVDFTKPVEGGGTIKAIGNNALQNCKVITALTLPETVTSIGAYALSGCSNLVRVEPFLPAAVTYLGAAAFMDCTSLEGDLVLGTNGVAVTLDGGNPNNGMQFRSTKITTLTLGEGVTVVRDDVFRGCTKLAEVCAHDNMTSIGNYCFAGCSSLTNFTPALPAKLTSIGGSQGCVFQGCGNLKIGVVIGSGVSSCSVGARTFQGAGITSVRFAGSVKTVPECCFEWCYNLTNAVLEEGVQSVALGAFQTTALTHIRLPEKSLTSLGVNCFRTTFNGDSRCTGLVSVEPFLPKSITYMGDRVFCWSFAATAEPSLDELVVQNDNGKNITIDDGWQFEAAKATKKVTLGPGVTKLVDGMLQNMPAVRELHFTCPYPAIDANKVPFRNWNTRQACVYVPAVQESWMRFLTNTTYVTPWKTVSDTLKTEFATKFAGYPRPFGLSTGNAMFGSQWIYKVNPPGLKLILQ